ncbi:hypothetical protein HDV05_001809 [Chytridiales sp. JEL 0842]|nr:hypothetical protein HDV05_001809 [Chytridiales sp. JEL 0842]
MPTHATSPCPADKSIKLLHLPTELLESILLHSANPSLPTTCKRFHDISSRVDVKLKLLMVEYGLISGDEAAGSTTWNSGILHDDNENDDRDNEDSDDDQEAVDYKRDVKLPHTAGLTLERFRCLVSSKRFTEPLALHLLQCLTTGPFRYWIYSGSKMGGGFTREAETLMQTLVEWAVLKTAIGVIQHLYPSIASSIDLPIPDVKTTFLQSCLTDAHPLVSHFLTTNLINPWTSFSTDSTTTNAPDPFVLACKHASLQTLKLLLATLPTPPSPSSSSLLPASTLQTINTGFSWASRAGHTHLLPLLLPFVKIESTQAVQWSAEYNQPSTLRFLLDNEAQKPEVNLQDGYGLRWASARGHVEVVRILLEKGADLNAQGGFALRHAVRFGEKGVVEVLVGEALRKGVVLKGLVECLEWVEGCGDEAMKGVLGGYVEGMKVRWGVDVK